MPQNIRIWEVADKAGLTEIPRAGLDLEDDLEGWLDTDISVLTDDLLVIGRQVETDYGGIVDLLCLDRQGDLVIIELKRAKRPKSPFTPAPRLQGQSMLYLWLPFGLTTFRPVLRSLNTPSKLDIRLTRKGVIDHKEP